MDTNKDDKAEIKADAEGAARDVKKPAKKKTSQKVVKSKEANTTAKPKKAGEPKKATASNKATTSKKTAAAKGKSEPKAAVVTIDPEQEQEAAGAEVEPSPKAATVLPQAAAKVGDVNTDAKLGECPAIDEDAGQFGTAEWNWHEEPKFSPARLADKVQGWLAPASTPALAPQDGEKPKDVKRPKRSKPWIFAGAGLLLVILLGFAIYGMWSLASGAGGSAGNTSEGAGVEAVIEDTSQVSIPNLAVLQGLSVDDALVALGAGWHLDSDVVDSASPAAGENTTPTIAVLAYSTTSDAPVLSPTVPTLELRLSANGNILSLEFIAPMDRLGYPQMAFTDLLGDRDLLRAALASAGIAANNSDLAAPTAEQLAEYGELQDLDSLADSTDTGNLDGTDNLNEADVPPTLETWTFSGKATGQTSGWWILTPTYDYTAGSASANEPLRTLAIALAA